MRRGEVRLTDLNPARGSEADKRRPAIVVSNDRANATARESEPRRLLLKITGSTAATTRVAFDG